MQKIHFPYLAIALGLIFMLIIHIGSETNAEHITRIPLLSLLIMNEFAFFTSASATYIGIKHIQSIGWSTPYSFIIAGCAILTLRFIVLGSQLWAV